MITFKTISGSLYTLYDNHWESDSKGTRTDSGKMFSHSEVKVGRSVIITGPGLNTGTRLIITSLVVKIF